MVPRRAARARGIRNCAKTAGAAIAFGGTVFFGLLAVAYWRDFGSLYLHTPGVWAGLFAVSWGAFWYVWSVQHLPYWVCDAGLAIARTDEWRSFVREWTRRLRHIPIVPIAAASVIVCLYYGLATGLAHKLWVLPSFHADWARGPNLVAKNVVLDLWAVALLSVAVPNVVGALKYAVLIHRLARFDLVRSLPVAREGLRPVAFFGLLTGTMWSLAGVVIVWILHPTSFDPGAVGIVAAVGAVGLQLIFWPQARLHAALRALQASLARPLIGQLRASSVAGAPPPADDGLRAVLAERTWVHDTGFATTAFVVGQFALPLASLVLSVTRTGGS
ncbi:MAG: hypothetical protein M3540_12735 [Actinomycetota bacterium]|nr:hypothetical protein [Actinomycetota bacterium]